jgi:hypothetical protein
MAFLARYGHQPYDVMLRMPVVDLIELSEAVGKIMEEEAEQTRRGTDID